MESPYSAEYRCFSVIIVQETETISGKRKFERFGGVPFLDERDKGERIEDERDVKRRFLHADLWESLVNLHDSVEERELIILV